MDLVARIAQFEKDMGRVARVTEQNSARMTAALGSVKAALSGLFAGFSVSVLVDAARAKIDAIDAFNDLKDATGASVENISALDNIARRTGANFDTVGTALVKFNAALKDDTKGGVFTALGLDVQKLRAMDPAAALLEVAKAFQGFAQDGNYARAVQELFGKSIREVAPFLKDLAEAGQLNAKVTTKQAEEAEKFNKEIFKLKASLSDPGKIMPLVVWINELSDSYKRAKENGEGLLRIIGRFSPQSLALGAMGINPSGTTEHGYGDARKGIADIDALLKGDPSLTKSERASMLSKRAALQKQLDGYLNSTAGAGRGIGGYEFTMPSLELPPPAGKTDKGKPPRDWMGNRAAWLAMHDVTSALAADADDAAAAMSVLQANAAAALRDSDGAMESMQKWVHGIKELEDEINELSGRTADDRKRQLTQTLEAMLKRDPNAYTPEELDRIVKGIGGIRDAITDAKDGASDFGGAFTSALDDVFLRAKSLGDVLRGLGINIASIAVQKAITNPLGNIAGNWLSGLLPKFDVGTDYVPRDMVAVVHKGEKIIPASQNRAGAGGGVVNVYLTTTDVASKSDVAAAARLGASQALAIQRRSAVYG